MKKAIPTELFNTWLFSDMEIQRRILHCFGKFEKRSYSILRKFIDIVHTERGFFTVNEDKMEFEWKWGRFESSYIERIPEIVEEKDGLNNLETAYALDFEKETGNKVPIIYSLLRIQNEDLMDEKEEDDNVDKFGQLIREDYPVFTIALSNLPDKMVVALEFAVSMMDKYNVIVRYSKFENPAYNLEILAFPKDF